MPRSPIVWPVFGHVWAASGVAGHVGVIGAANTLDVRCRSCVVRLLLMRTLHPGA